MKIKKQKIWTRRRNMDGEKIFSYKYVREDSTSIPSGLEGEKIIDLDVDDLIKTISQEGEIVESEKKWGFVRKLHFRGLELSLGHFNAQGDEGLQMSRDDSFPIDLGRDKAQTINFLNSIQDAVWENIEDLIAVMND